MLNNKKVSFHNSSNSIDLSQTLKNNNKVDSNNDIKATNQNQNVCFKLQNYSNNSLQYITPSNLNSFTKKVSHANFSMNLAQENQLQQLQYLNDIHKKNMYQKQFERLNTIKPGLMNKESQKINQTKIFAIKKSIY